MASVKMQRDQAKTKLSTGILNMKFMKKTKDKLDKEQEDNEGRMMYASDITYEMRTCETQYVVISSRAACENLIEGRVSFGGINPDIERIMKEEHDKRTVIEEKKNETDISDMEMAQTYNTLVDQIAMKFNKHNRKRDGSTKPYDRSNKKSTTTFLKPQDT